MANVLTSDKKLAVIHQLVEGSSIRSTERITGVHRDTICRLLVKVGNQCRELLDERMRGLTLAHVQVDEIWTYVFKKEGRIPVQEKDPFIGDQYLFVAFDESTKLVASFALGKRTKEMTRRFIADLAGRMTQPKPSASDDRNFTRPGYKPITRISSDGWPFYPQAIDSHFGPHAQYGQIIKEYRNAEMPGRYAAPEMIKAARRPVFGMRESDAGTICTSHVERNNLTIRTFIRRFTRLSLGFSKKLENLAAAVALHVAYYNFCRRHGSLRVTPAMAAGITDTLWSLGDLLERSQS